MILSAKEVENIIPQKYPMVMVGSLLSVDEKSLTSEFNIPKDHIFLENRILSRAALIENIAQTAAVKAGYFAQKEKQQPKTGFIGAIKNFEIYESAKAGDTLTTTITTTNEIFNASIIEGKILRGNTLVAQGELKIFLVENPTQES